MDFSITSQFIRSNYLLYIRPLVTRKSLAWVFSMCFLANFDSKPENLIFLTTQYHPSWGKLFTGFQLLLTENMTIVLLLYLFTVS